MRVAGAGVADPGGDAPRGLLRPGQALGLVVARIRGTVRGGQDGRGNGRQEDESEEAVYSVVYMYIYVVYSERYG